MSDSVLTKLVSLVLAVAMAGPMSAAAGAMRCDCGLGSGEAVVGGAHGAEGVDVGCCGGCGEKQDSEDQRSTPSDDCRDCGCPVCALHLGVVAVVWSGPDAAAAREPSELGATLAPCAPAWGDVSDLMRPPRAMTA